MGHPANDPRAIHNGILWIVIVGSSFSLAPPTVRQGVASDPKTP
jgi:hypothetical protein